MQTRLPELQRPRLQALVSSLLQDAKQPFLYVRPLQHSGRSSVASHLLVQRSSHAPACSTDLMMATPLHLAKQQLANVVGP
jgi:hypothetical protein